MAKRPEFVKIPKYEYEILRLAENQFNIMKEIGFEVRKNDVRTKTPSCDADFDVALGCPIPDGQTVSLSDGRIECTRCGNVNGWANGRCSPLTVSSIKTSKKIPLACGSKSIAATDGCMGKWKPVGQGQSQTVRSYADEHTLLFYNACIERKQQRDDASP